MSAAGASVGALVSQGAGKITLMGRPCGARSVLGAVGAAGSAAAEIVIITSATGTAKALIDSITASLFDATTSCHMMVRLRWRKLKLNREQVAIDRVLCTPTQRGLFMRRKR